MSRKRHACARVMFSRARPWNAARPRSVWFSTPTASPASITRLFSRRGQPVVNLAQHAPHVNVRGAVAHEHRQPLQLLRRLPRDCRAAPGRKSPPAVPPRTPRRSPTVPAARKCPAIGPAFPASVIMAQAAVSPASTFRIETEQRASQQARRGIRAFEVAAPTRKNYPRDATGRLLPVRRSSRFWPDGCSSVNFSAGVVEGIHVSLLLPPLCIVMKFPPLSGETRASPPGITQ